MKKKRDQLSERGILTVIKTFASESDIKLDALFVNDKPVMWPGKCITLRYWTVNHDRVVLGVSEISYPFISALSDQNFLRTIPDQNLSLLRPPLAICTFAITSDNFLALTVRGISTNVYPGRFYGQGGNPENADVDLLQHQLDEIEEELLIKPSEVDHDSLKFFGIIEDHENFPGKPDLIGTVQVFISSNQLKERFESRSIDHRPPDVGDVRFVHFDEKSLADFLHVQTQAEEFCPPAHGGLSLIGSFEFGEKWREKLITNL